MSSKGDTPVTDQYVGRQLQDLPEWVDADLARDIERTVAEKAREVEGLQGKIKRYEK